MKTASEIMTLSICLQIGLYVAIFAGIGGTWVSSNQALITLSQIIVGIGVTVGVAIIILAAFFSGAGNSLIYIAGKTEMSAGMAAIAAVYGSSVAASSIILLTLPWGLGVPVSIIFALISGIAILWDIAERGAPTGGFK